MSRDVASLGSVATRGAAWIAASQAIRWPVQIGITVVLARVVGPEEFGLFAMIAVVVDVLTMVASLGIRSIIVSHEDPTEGDLSTLFWLQLGFGVLLAAVTVLLAPVVSSLYGEPRLARLTRVLAWTWLVSPVGSVPMALLERRLAFARIAVVEAVSLTVSGAFSMAMALLGSGAVSLVYLIVSGLWLQAVLALLLTGWIPRLVFQPRSVTKVARFGLNLTVHRVVYYLGRHLDTFLVGRYLGATALGHYALAYRIAIDPILALLGVATRVMLPVLVSIRVDVERMREGYLRGLQWLGMVTFPLLATLLIGAGELVELMFGEHWRPVVPLIRGFCLAGMLRVTFTTSEPLFLVLHRTGLLLGLGLATLVATALVYAVGLPWGLPGVVVAFLVSSLVSWGVFHAATNRLLGVSFRRFAGALAWPVGLAVATGTAAAGAGFLADLLGAAAALRLVVIAMVAALTWLVVLRIGGTPMLEEARNIGREVVGNVTFGRLPERARVDG
jgi:PST family polysaccharide transporter